MRGRHFISCMAVLLLTPAWIVGSASPAGAFCVERDVVVNTICDGQGHKTITERALDFLSPGIRSRIKEKNIDQDGKGTADRPELHFTNCLFTKSTEYIRSQYDQVLSAISTSVGPTDSSTATMRWGQLLHPVQDFYSHSPWVDPVPVGLGFGTTYPKRLLDSGLGNWRRLGPYEKLFPADSVNSDIVTVQGNIWGVIDLPRDQFGNPKSAVPNVWPFYSGRLRGLMTASSKPFTNGDGQCPPPGQAPYSSNLADFTCLDKESVCIRHGGGECQNYWGTNDRPIYDNCLQHDVDSRVNWEEAFDSAVAQTEHEWCRLLNMTRDQKSFNAASIPMALWVTKDDPPNATPHPAGTACAPEHKRDIDLRLTISVETQGRRDNPNLSFVAYTGDFRQSVRTLIRANKADASLDICLNRDDTLVTTLWGWSDKTYSSLLGGGDGSYDPWEPVLAGTTKAFAGPNFPSSEHIGVTPDLLLKLKLSPDLSNDCPN